ncbi:hypothetical protein ACOSP7_001274 [Xanthoceras sorbifolium]
MQSIKLPSEICCKLDKINRNFLWGHTMDKKSVHLVNWDMVCRPKIQGGLGIKKMKMMNQALLAKAGWRLLQGDGGLWGKMLNRKYLNNCSVGDFSNSKNGASSSTWRGIMIGKGKDIFFWTDLWVKDVGIFQQHATIPLDQDQLNKKVDWFLDNGTWNTKKMSTFLPWEVILRVCAICVNRSDSGKDRQIWGLEKNGCFSVKSAYKVACSDDNIDLWDWRSLWKLKLPPKISYFLWIVCHGKLLTNSQRIIRGISNDAYCPRCNSADENILHLFRGCTASIRVWEDVMRVCRPFKMLQGKSCNDLNNWLKINLNNNMIIGATIPSSFLFTATLVSNSNHPLYNLIFNCKELILGRWQCTIAHIFREGNAVADCLAGLSKNRERRTAYFQSPPPEIASLLECDAGNLLDYV